MLCGGEYVEFLRKRLILMRKLLTDDGSIYLHLDNKMVFAMKLIMDELFGEELPCIYNTQKVQHKKLYRKYIW